MVLSQAITPTNASSVIRFSASFVVSATNSNLAFGVAVFRGTTCIGTATTTTPGNQNGEVVSVTFYDSPATTSAVTYTMRVAKLSGSGTWYINSTPSGLWGSTMAANAYSVEELLAN